MKDDAPPSPARGAEAGSPEIVKPRNAFPKGWDEESVRDLIAHYENQSEDEAAAEDEAPYHDPKQTMMAVPVELVPEVQKLIAKARDSV